MIGYINKIETMGLVDGPGVRTIIFLQGCPLRCLFCHNPETWKIKAGEEYTPEELFETIMRYKNYYGESGGITFSGGEPLLQSEFLVEVCKLLKKENIHICLDTAGVGTNNYEILDYIDLVIFDIKGINAENYNNITSYPMNKSMEFLNVCQEKNKQLWLRQVIVPGINDNETYILRLKEFIKDIKNVERLELLPYHTMGVNKYKELNINYPLKNVQSMDKEKCKQLETLLKR